MVFDAIVTLAMNPSLHRARSGISRINHVITLLTLFTVNTNLITTSVFLSPLSLLLRFAYSLLSVGSLVTVGMSLIQSPHLHLISVLSVLGPSLCDNLWRGFLPN
ncbi:hypothetical protein DFS33DRAFT_659903 [Desarmillaria ectypa]|nr:hypothetical protein DFS33DRAFT_659903 [Desarmillaria ectypa]